MHVYSTMKIIISCAVFVYFQFATCYGRVRVAVQLLRFNTPNYLMASGDCTCERQISGQKWPFCNYQLTTIVDFAPLDDPPTVVSTKIINPTNRWIQFNQTPPVENCHQDIARSAGFSCNDTTWQDEIVYDFPRRPTSITVNVKHFGDVICNGLASDHLIPQSVWHVDTFHFRLTHYVPSAPNSTRSNKTLLQSYGQAKNDNLLQMFLEMQCSDNWGPNCNFVDCISVTTNTYSKYPAWQCRTEIGIGNWYDWLCTNSTTSGQPINCSHCKRGITADGVCLTSDGGDDCENCDNGILPSSVNYIVIIVVLGCFAAAELLFVCWLIYLISKKASEKKMNKKTQPSDATKGAWWNTKKDNQQKEFATNLVFTHPTRHFLNQSDQREPNVHSVTRPLTRPQSMIYTKPQPRREAVV